MKFKKLSIEALENQHLSVLRELGRALGVKSPASKKKTQLIVEIQDIQNGRYIPDNSTKRGAPPKIRIDITKFLADESDSDENVFVVNTELDEESEKEDLNNGYKDSKPPKYYPAYNAKEEAVKKHFSDFSQQIFEDSENDDEMVFSGVLDIHPAGYGFLRCYNYDCKKGDAYISVYNIKKYNLRKGDMVKAIVKKGKGGDSPAVQTIKLVNDKEPSVSQTRFAFEELTPCYPNEKIILESFVETSNNTVRCIDLLAPIGKGQRGLIVAPPKTGKTTMLKRIAQSIEKLHPEIKLFVLLIDERPEEVTDIKSCIKAEIAYSTFDEDSEHHIRTAEKLIERAKRLVEMGEDVVILMDSITRLVRAYNRVIEPSGKTLSGGLDPKAIVAPKRLFGSARNVEQNGSLTIIATALVDTGSRMDDVIYEEFKGTGNMEIQLSREYAERNVFPAIDVFKTSTRRSDLLLHKNTDKLMSKLNNFLASHRDRALEILLEMMSKSENNLDLLCKLDAWIKIYNKDNESSEK